MARAPPNRKDFRIALFCALPLEAENVQSVFDTCWEDQNVPYGKAPGDPITYSTGVIGKHNVVLVHMPDVGQNSASAAAAGLRSSFRGIQLAIVVGICGVAPVHPETNQEIVLGDIIISTAVIQYDFGRKYPGIFKRTNKIEDSLGRANVEIRSFLNRLKTRQALLRFVKTLEKFVHSAELGKEVRTVIYPGVIHDRLYEASYPHQHRLGENCEECLEDLKTCSKTCDELGCEKERLVSRVRHTSQIENLQTEKLHTPAVHLGRFGSANTVMKSGQDRDQISAADNIVAFEMEGAGVWEQYPTVVIKAACDYSDSHKNKIWQGYAAAMAAACLKVFLQEWVSEEQSSDRSQYSMNGELVEINAYALSGDLNEPVWHIPFAATPGFIGREDELRALEVKLLDSDTLRIVSLLGLGGVGKSRLALEVAYRFQSKHPQRSIFWLQASDLSTLDNDMLEVGRKLKIAGIEDEKADVKALVKQRLSLSSAEKWLLIVDNADDEVLWGTRPSQHHQGFSLVNCLPKTTHGSILITTRTRRVASFLAGKEVIELNGVTQDEASTLFTSKLEDPDLAVNRVCLLNIVNKLACLPLALVQAASYVNMTKTSIQTYYDLLAEPEAEVIKVLSEDFGDESRYPDAINAVATTWLISFEHIKKRHSLAANFLAAMACFHEKGIPLSLLPRVKSKFDSIEALSVLTGYSFITRQNHPSGASDEDQIFDVHRLVHLAVRNWLKKECLFSEWVKTCLIHVVQIFPAADYEHRGLRTMYTPHAQRVCDESHDKDWVERYDLLEGIGLGMMQDGRYNEAVETLTVVLTWRERALSLPDAKIFEVYSLLGTALRLRGDFQKAVDYLQRAVDGKSSLLGNKHCSTLISMDSLAMSLQGRGMYFEAERLHREVLILQEVVLGKIHPDALNSMHNLANSIFDQGRYIEAEKLLRKVLRLREKVLGKGHPSTLISMNDLATSLHYQGRQSEAEKMRRESLQLQENVLGRSHPDTLVSMNNLAISFDDQGKHIEAERMYREVLQLQEIILGKSHPDTLTSMNNLAISLSYQDRNIEAENIHREVLQLREIVLGKSHPDTLISINNLAISLHYQSKTNEAEKIHRQVLNLQETILGPNHPHTLISMNNLALSMKENNRVEEAVELMRCCIKLRTNILGFTHPSTQDSLRSLEAWLGSTPETIKMRTHQGR